jgi:hypothetical protein
MFSSQVTEYHERAEEKGSESNLGQVRSEICQSRPEDDDSDRREIRNRPQPPTGPGAKRGSGQWTISEEEENQQE